MKKSQKQRQRAKALRRKRRKDSKRKPVSEFKLRSECWFDAAQLFEKLMESEAQLTRYGIEWAEGTPDSVEVSFAFGDGTDGEWVRNFLELTGEYADERDSSVSSQMHTEGNNEAKCVCGECVRCLTDRLMKTPTAGKTTEQERRIPLPLKHMLEEFYKYLSTGHTK